MKYSAKIPLSVTIEVDVNPDEWSAPAGRASVLARKVLDNIASSLSAIGLTIERGQILVNEIKEQIPISKEINNGNIES